MANHKSAKKRIRQNEKKRIRNRHVRSTLRSVIKSFETALQNQDADQVKTLFTKTVSTIDKAASKGIIPKNNASRRVSRLTMKARNLLATPQ